MAGSLIPKLVAQASVSTPPAGYIAIFGDIADGIARYKDESGVVHDFSVVNTEQVQDIVGAFITDSSSIDFTYDDSGNTLTAVVKPSSITNAMLATGAVTDDKASLAIKPSIGLVATTNLTLSGAQTIDSILGTAGTTLVLATAQTSGAENGPWLMQAGAWTRPTWYPSGGTTQAFQFITVFVRIGTLYQGSKWRMTTSGAITIDTTPTVWAQTLMTLSSTSVSGTLPAAQLPALTGDITTSAGSAATTLASVISAGGPTGSSSVVPVITYDAKGRLTTVTTATVTTTAIGAVPTTRNINTTAPITGGGDLSADRTIALTTSPTGQTPVGITRNINTTAPITGGGDLSADRTIALTTSPTGQTPVGITRNINTTAPITGGGDLSADRTLALTTSPTGQTPVGVTRTINTTAPITGGGNLSADLTLALTTSPTGQTPVGLTRTITATAPITIAGGTSADLSADRTVAITAATTLASGSMSATDKKRMGRVYDAVADFGFVGDLITVFDGAMTTGGSSTTLTCATSTPFTSTLVDGGKRITVRGAGAGGAQLTTTIATISSSSVAILTVGCSTTVTVAGTSFGTDNTTAISNMTTLVNTTNASFPGVKIIFGQSATNAYGFPTPVVFNKTVVLEGIGGAFNTDNGDYTRIGGTRLAWWGTTSDGAVDFGAFFTFQPGAGATQALKNISLKDLWIDGRNGDQNAALYGVRIAGCHSPYIENVFIMDCRAAGLLCNATAISLNPTSDRGVLRPTIKAFFVRNLETFVGAITTPLTTSSAITLSNTGQNITVSASTMPVDASSTSYAWIQNTEGTRTLVKYTGGGTTTLNVKCSVEDALHSYVTIANAFVASAAPQNATCVTFDGDTTANTNCGSCDMWQFTHGTVWGPAALDLRNADSMHFSCLYINGGNPTAEANPLINRTRKEGVTLAGSITNVGLAARNITFNDGDPSSSTAAGITILGLVAAGTAIAFPPGPCYWDLHQLANGARIPNVEGLTTSATQGKAGGAFDWNPNGGLRVGVRNLSIVDQTPAAATLTHLLGSMITVPPQGFQVGTAFRWTMPASKTAAGTAARTFHVRVGTTGSTSDAIVSTLTMPVGTAALDTGVFTITGIMRVIGASASLQTALNLTHAGGSAALGGFTALSINSPVQIGAATTFSSITSGLLYLSVTLTTGAAEVITFQQIMSEVIFPGSP